MSYSLHGKSLLITDGTGSFGKQFVRTAQEPLDLKKIVVFSRDELKQFEMDLAAAVAPECAAKIVGIRPGEKLHEVMVPEDDARSSVELPDRYVIQPGFEWFDFERHAEGSRLPDGFRYGSDNNPLWLTKSELVEMIGKLNLAEAL